MDYLWLVQQRHKEQQSIRVHFVWDFITFDLDFACLHLTLVAAKDIFITLSHSELLPYDVSMLF